MFETRKELVAYLAGFLDGEGSFIIIYDSNGVFSPRVTAGQVDTRPLELLQETFGGKIHTNKVSYNSSLSDTILSNWYITGPTMHDAILELRPYLMVKAEQADILLELIASINMYKGRVGRNREFPFLPEEIREYRYTLYSKCKELKHGPAATTKRKGLSLIEGGSDSLNCGDDKAAEVAEMTTHPQGSEGVQG